MRRVAAYCLNMACAESPNIVAAYKSVTDRLTEWLCEKGADHGAISDDKFVISLEDGRNGHCEREHIETVDGEYTCYLLTEPRREGGEFRTMLSVVRKEVSMAFYCTLEVGHSETVISPISFDARCPAVVRTVIQADYTWKIGDSPHSGKSRRYSGSDGGTKLAVLVRNPRRAIPLVVVSEHQGFELHPGMHNRLASQLVGLANVCSIDDEAAWEMTNRLGKEWSCFGASVRLYWPQASQRSDPFKHPLWTATSLMNNSTATEQAASRLVDQLRRKLMEVASFSVREPKLIGVVRQDARRIAHEQRLAQAKTLEDFRRLAEDYARENDKIHDDLKNAREQLSRAETDLANEKLINQHKVNTTEVAPETETPPLTVVEAFATARKTLSQFLYFGEDCERGVSELSEIAGPPEKILKWLQQLAKVSQLRRDQPLGKNDVQWLRESGVRVSGESESDNNNRGERQKRMWRVGKNNLYFNLHMKPAEAVPADRCVRIYFRWMDTMQCYAIGWIGRHPS